MPSCPNRMRWTYGLLAFFLSTSGVTAQPADCNKVGQPDTDLTISSRVVLERATCIEARNLTLTKTADIVAEGSPLTIRIVENLYVEKGAKVRAYGDRIDYVPAIERLPAISPPSYNPGPNTAGNPNGEGRSGGGPPLKKFEPHPDFNPDFPSFERPEPLSIRVLGLAQGHLEIDWSGTQGDAGSNGREGWYGGNGEQGRQAQGDGHGFCAAGGAMGGNGGDGGSGDEPGDGRSGGRGGDVAFSIATSSSGFTLHYRVSGGAPGEPGIPGLGGKPGLQGCGGRSNGVCPISEVARRQGLIGLPGKSGPFGKLGKAGLPGSIKVEGEFRTVDLDNDICRPYEVSPEDAEKWNKTLYFSFWTLAGRHLFGSDYKVLDVKGGQALVIPVQANGNHLLSYIHPLHFYLNEKNEGQHGPPLPQVPGCVENLCCHRGKATVECLSAPGWNLRRNKVFPSSNRRDWLVRFFGLLGDEAYRSRVATGAQGDIVPLLEANGVYADFGVSGDRRYLVRLDEDFFVRTALTIAALYPQLQRVLDSRAMGSVLLCAGSGTRRVGPVNPSNNGPLDTLVAFPQGYELMHVISDKSGVVLQSATPKRQFLVMQVARVGTQTFVQIPFGVAAENAAKYPDRPGFRRGGFCSFYSPASRFAPFSCSETARKLVAGIQQDWSFFDVPSVITVMHILLFLDALKDAERLTAFQSGTTTGELAKHCLPM